MQWIFMAVGMVLGVMLGQSFLSMLFGGLFGLFIGQAVALRRLRERCANLQKQLDEFVRRAGNDARELFGRIERLERGGAPSHAETPAAAETAGQSQDRGVDQDVAVFNLDLPPEVEEYVPPVGLRRAPAASVAEAAAVATGETPAADAENRNVASPSPFSETAASSLPFAQSAASSSLPFSKSAASSPLPSAASAASPSPFSAAASAKSARPRPSRPPRPPSFVERAVIAAKEWLLGGNTVLRVGVVLLFIGLAFLLRYASERVVVPVELRYAGVALCAVVLLGLGWRLRERKGAYGLILQGTGIAVLYLTVFAAMRLHPLIAPELALLLLVAVTVCSAILAVVQNAMGLAAAAALGGFAAPILTSTGSGDHVALFSYFALLNAGIFAIAWFKAWRELNLIGFIGTFGIGFAWGLRSYQPELFSSTEPFLILFFLMYVGIGLLFARRKLRDAAAGAPVAPDNREEWLRWSARQGDYIDGSVLFGPPLVGFGLQCAVIGHIQFGMAFSALVLGLFYLTVARCLYGRMAGRVSLLVEVCLALGVIFGTLAIPLGLDARWTSAAWAVEGAGIYWLGLRQRRRLARSFALALQAGAALAFLQTLRAGDETLISGSALGALMLGAALLFSYAQLRRSDRGGLSAWEPECLPVLACGGLFFVYLIAPLCFGVNMTAVSWALGGLLTIFAGLRLKSRTFLMVAFAVQLAGGVLFLLHLQRAQAGAGGVLSSGWSGLMVASLIGLALIAGTAVASRDPLVKDNARALPGLGVILLLGLVFINLAVLFVLPWISATAVWAGSGVLIIWLSLMLRQRIGFYFGVALQVIGGAAFLAAGPAFLQGLSGAGLRPLAHWGFWTPVILALAAMLGAWRLRHSSDEEEGALAAGSLGLKQLSQALLLWGAAWWIFSALSEIGRFVPVDRQAAVALLTAAASVALWTLFALRERWRFLALLCLLLIPSGFVALCNVNALRYDYHPLAHFGWLAWPALFAVHFMSLRRLPVLLPQRVVSAAHILGCWLLLGVLSLELRYLFFALADYDSAWRWLGWALAPSAYLLLMANVRNLPWPVAAYPREYRLYAALPVGLCALAWFWLANWFSDGSADPLPYLPLANPLEIGLLIVLFSCYQWGRRNLTERGLTLSRSTRYLQGIAGASLFALLTLAVCRFSHHWFDVTFHFAALSGSMVVQAGLSLVWTLGALALMISGNRLYRRELWMIGAALVAVVVVKLFFIELGNSGSLARIVSFIGVGALLLVVGYFSPLPPKQKETPAESEQI